MYKPTPKAHVNVTPFLNLRNGDLSSGRPTLSSYASTQGSSYSQSNVMNAVSKPAKSIETSVSVQGDSMPLPMPHFMGQPETIMAPIPLYIICLPPPAAPPSFGKKLNATAPSFMPTLSKLSQDTSQSGRWNILVFTLSALVTTGA